MLRLKHNQVSNFTTYFNIIYLAFAMSSENTVTVTLPQLAKMIDHSLLHPSMTDADILAGLKIARDNNVATACVRPYLIPLAKQELAGSDVLVCPVIGFPHGNSTTEIKVQEATAAAQAGGQEIDMIVNVGKVLGGDWEYVAREIDAINRAVVQHGAILKVIFENDYLQSEHVVKLCEICTQLEVAFVKTSTGYGFVKQPDGSYNYLGATVQDLKLMRKHSGAQVQIKAAGRHSHTRRPAACQEPGGDTHWSHSHRGDPGSGERAGDWV